MPVSPANADGLFLYLFSKKILRVPFFFVILCPEAKVIHLAANFHYHMANVYNTPQAKGGGGKSKAEAFMAATLDMTPQGEPKPEQVQQINFKSYLVDMTELAARPDFRLRAHGVGLIPSGSITAVSGQAKQGKTQFLTAITAVMMSGKNFGAMKRETAPQAILWADTEQSVYDIQTNLGRLYNLAGIPQGTPTEKVGLHVLTLRACSAEERLQIIQQAIDETDPEIIIIDGVRDLLHDFNDITQSDQVITWVMKNSAARPQSNIFCVIHTNDGTDKMRGHLGTELMNKCADRFTVTKKNGHFEVKHTARHQELNAPFVFKINEEGQLAPVEDAETSGLIEEPCETLADIFKGEETLSFAEITKRFAKAQGISQVKASELLKQNFINTKLIKKGDAWRLA